MSDKPILQNATIHFNDAGTPVAEAFDDVYFSNDNGLEESRYVFLQQNGLPERWSEHPYPHFTIFETGFGTGLNFLLSWQQFREYKQRSPGSTLKLHFVTFEKFPLNVTDLERALQAWPSLSSLSDQLVSQYPLPLPGCHRLLFEDVTLDIWLGDVNSCLPELVSPHSGLADAWYLDGFAPSKNADMWQQELFDQMGRFARNGCTIATFTAAGFVRRGLIEAGFEMEKRPGFGRKREMIAGRFATEKPAPSSRPESLAIIGAGLAGCHLAYSLSRRDVAVSIYEQHAEPGMAASGNRQGALYPLLNGAHDQLSQFFSQGFGLGRRVVEQVANLSTIPLRYEWCGVLHYAFDEKHQKKQTTLCNAGLPEQLVQWVDAEKAEQLSGIKTGLPGVFYPEGGWVNPPSLCQALLGQQTTKSDYHFNSVVAISKAPSGGWQVNTGEKQQSYAHLVFATGAQSSQFDHLTQLPLQAVRGQVSHLEATDASQQLKTVVCHSGYASPAMDNQHCIGATFDRSRADTELDRADHIENISRFAQNLTPSLFAEAESVPLKGRVGFRSRVRDHLPLVGRIASENSEGLYIVGALGARGICSAALCAELLASHLCGEPLPLERKLVDAVAADRFERKRKAKEAVQKRD